MSLQIVEMASHLDELNAEYENDDDYQEVDDEDDDHDVDNADGGDDEDASDILQRLLSQHASSRQPDEETAANPFSRIRENLGRPELERLINL